MLPKQVCEFAAQLTEKENATFSIDSLFVFFCLLFSFCSLREQEQNECKFYNELGQFLVKDFTPVPQMNKMTEEYDDDFSAFSQQDTGLYCHLHVIGGKGRNWLWWFKVYLYKESLNYII